jgi:diacylglycerol kinase (ATP)
MTARVETKIDEETERGRRLHVIVNPMSANGSTRRAWPAIERRLARLDYQVTFWMTESSGDGIRLGARAAEAGAEEILVVGGDGTLNEVVNGLFAATHGEPPAPIVSLLPAGTGRDFSRSMGIRSFDHAVEILGEGRVEAIDVGRVDYSGPEGGQSRYFMNMGDVGIGAETAALLNRSSKVLGGTISYFIGAARTIFRFQGKPAQVTVDGEVIHDGPLAMACFANGRFLAGGMRMAPNASIQDGLFDVLVLHDVPKYSLLFSLLPSVYFGRHLNHPAVSHRTGRVVTVTAPEPMKFEVDGEQPGTTDITAELMPGALRMRLPARYADTR